MIRELTVLVGGMRSQVSRATRACVCLVFVRCGRTGRAPCATCYVAQGARVCALCALCVGVPGCILDTRALAAATVGSAMATPCHTRRSDSTQAQTTHS